MYVLPCGFPGRFGPSARGVGVLQVADFRVAAYPCRRGDFAAELPAWPCFSGPSELVRRPAIVGRIRLTAESNHFLDFIRSRVSCNNRDLILGLHDLEWLTTIGLPRIGKLAHENGDWWEVKRERYRSEYEDC